MAGASGEGAWPTSVAEKRRRRRWPTAKAMVWQDSTAGARAGCKQRKWRRRCSWAVVASRGRSPEVGGRRHYRSKAVVARGLRASLGSTRADSCWLLVAQDATGMHADCLDRPRRCRRQGCSQEKGARGCGSPYMVSHAGMVEKMMEKREDCIVWLSGGQRCSLVIEVRSR